MRQENITTINQKIIKIRFGILKAPKTVKLKSPISFMVEAEELTDDGHLLCRASDPSLLRIGAETSRVILKFIQKREGLFIKLTGWITNSDSKDGCTIKVRIDQAHCFQKKSTSPYTSFLQSLGLFTGNFRQVGHAV